MSEARRPIIVTWDDKLAYSETVTRSTALDQTVRTILPGCVSVQIVPGKSPLQPAGVDVIATLAGGAKVLIDIKSRTPGCAKYWKCGPELSLEIWNVCPSASVPDGKIGWTRDESKRTHYTLHVFAPADTRSVYLLPFQLLRAVFTRHLPEWGEQYKHGRQETDRDHGRSRWRSECVFVPAIIVKRALVEAMEMGPRASAGCGELPAPVAGIAPAPRNGLASGGQLRLGL